MIIYRHRGLFHLKKRGERCAAGQRTYSMILPVVNIKSWCDENADCTKSPWWNWVCCSLLKASQIAATIMKKRQARAESGEEASRVPSAGPAIPLIRIWPGRTGRLIWKLCKLVCTLITPGLIHRVSSDLKGPIKHSSFQIPNYLSQNFWAGSLLLHPQHWTEVVFRSLCYTQEPQGWESQVHQG